MATTLDDRVKAIRLAHRLLDGWEHFKSQRPEVLEALLETAEDLDGKILAQSGQTHWEGCWKEHLTCSLQRLAEMSAAWDLDREMLGGDRIEELEAENARMRSTLERYADRERWAVIPQGRTDCWVWVGGFGAAFELAQRALRGE